MPDIALTTITLAALGWGLALGKCYFAELGSAFIGVGLVRRMSGAPWLLQVALLYAAILPALCYSVLMNDTNANGEIVILSAFLSIPIHRYAMVRDDCRRVAAVTLADRTLLASEAAGRSVDLLLAGLLPQHAVPHASWVATKHAAAGDYEVQPSYLACGRGLSILQVELRPADGSAAGMASAWADTAAVVAARFLEGGGGPLLEVVQATGDSFVVAGPFTKDGQAPSEATSVAAARCVGELLQNLSQTLRGKCGFTAVATSGEAFGCLLGASLITFRLFGAAVREGNAILAAAPRPLDPTAHVVFASESFRRQERNFVVPRSIDRDAAMSLAMDAAAINKEPATEQQQPPRPEAANSCLLEFGAPALWRVRGMGAALVSTVVVE